MTDDLDSTKQILKNLVSYPVHPNQSNLDLIDYIVSYLEILGIKPELIYSPDNSRANLFATIGNNTSGGIMLSGHTDVVSVEGQNWNSNPFELVEKNNCLFARGATDMKGFLACCLAMVPKWLQQNLEQPIQLGFTFDEESGGEGAARLAKWLAKVEHKPSCAIIGEPTSMQIIAGHKGGSEIKTIISGLEGHSCNPENGVNAIHYAVKMIDFILNIGEQLKQNPPADSIFEPPYSSFNIGKITGGSSTNTIAGNCELQWEIRPVPGDDANGILSQIDDYCQNVLAVEMCKRYPFASIETHISADVPGLAIKPDSIAINLIKAITGNDRYDVVAFGTDAGYFQNVGIDSVVYGPGNIIQAHKPDEYIENSQLILCLDFLSKLGTVKL